MERDVEVLGDGVDSNWYACNGPGEHHYGGEAVGPMPTIVFDDLWN